MDNTYGKRALKSMYEMIWNCSTVSVLDKDTEDEANALFVEVLKNIDDQLTRALDAEGDWEDNLIPNNVTTMADATHTEFMYKLLTGSCRRLAQDRVHAIKAGRSIPSYMELLASETEKDTIDIVRRKIDEEVKAAKEAGLNFNVLCNIWLCK